VDCWRAEGRSLVRVGKPFRGDGWRQGGEQTDDGDEERKTMKREMKKCGADTESIGERGRGGPGTAAPVSGGRVLFRASANPRQASPLILDGRNTFTRSFLASKKCSFLGLNCSFPKTELPLPKDPNRSFPSQTERRERAVAPAPSLRRCHGCKGAQDVVRKC
jgi:hypothetical protein